MRVWTEIKNWLGLHDIDPMDWRLALSVEVWWDEFSHKRGDSCKAHNTLMMLVAWEIWNEHNTRIFRDIAATATIIITKIKDEASLWARVGAKYLSNVMPRE